MTRASWEPPRYSDEDHDAMSYVLDEWADGLADALPASTPAAFRTYFEGALVASAQHLYYHPDPFDRHLHRDWLWHTTPPALRARAHQLMENRNDAYDHA